MNFVDFFINITNSNNKQSLVECFELLSKKDLLCFLNLFSGTRWNPWNGLKKPNLLQKSSMCPITQKMVSHIEILNYKKYWQLTKSITFWNMNHYINWFFFIVKARVHLLVWNFSPISSTYATHFLRLKIVSRYGVLQKKIKIANDMSM
jgi:hypothetical protein